MGKGKYMYISQSKYFLELSDLKYFWSMVTGWSSTLALLEVRVTRGMVTMRFSCTAGVEGFCGRRPETAEDAVCGLAVAGTWGWALAFVRSFKLAEDGRTSRDAALPWCGCCGC